MEKKWLLLIADKLYYCIHWTFLLLGNLKNMSTQQWKCKYSPESFYYKCGQFTAVKWRLHVNVFVKKTCYTYFGWIHTYWIHFSCLKQTTGLILISLIVLKLVQAPWHLQFPSFYLSLNLTTWHVTSVFLEQLLASRLSKKHLLYPSTRTTFYHERQEERCEYFSQEYSIVFSHHIDGVSQYLGVVPYDSNNWRLFLDSSKRSLKCVLNRNGNEYPSVPIGHFIHAKETYENAFVTID